MAVLWRLSGTRVLDINAAIAVGARVRFFAGHTTTPLTVYADPALATPLPQEVMADAFGLWPAIYLPYGDYDEQALTSEGAQLWYFRGIANPAPGSGSGGGSAVGADQIFQTGDVLWLPRAGLRAGWVRDNGRTIGSAGSGATERANADTQALFEYLWLTYDNTICPVSGGRGATGAADFAANKTIALPDLRGRTPTGLDDMGNGAANRIQVSTTITTSNGSTSAVVANATGLAIGMKVRSAHVPSGTTVTDIAGSMITLSAVATAAESGTPARFSFFDDAQVAGSTGGVHTHLQRVKELAQHNHGGSTGSAGSTELSYTMPGAPMTAYISGSNAQAIAITSTGTIAVPAHMHAIASDGASLPMINLQPSVLGTFYRKL
jgi:microcystin-dependent protein